MMKVFPYLAVAVLLVGGQQGYKWYTAPPPPPPEMPELPARSPEADLLCKSMIGTKGWRIGKNGNSVVNEEANMVVVYDGGTHARVIAWQFNGDKAPAITLFDDDDLRHVGAIYPKARKLIERATTLGKLK